MLQYNLLLQLVSSHLHSKDSSYRNFITLKNIIYKMINHPGLLKLMIKTCHQVLIPSMNAPSICLHLQVSTPHTTQVPRPPSIYVSTYRFPPLIPHRFPGHLLYMSPLTGFHPSYHTGSQATFYICLHLQVSTPHTTQVPRPPSIYVSTYRFPPLIPHRFPGHLLYMSPLTGLHPSYHTGSQATFYICLHLQVSTPHTTQVPRLPLLPSPPPPPPPPPLR